MAWCRTGVKPLPEPMLAHCQLDSWDQISVKFKSEFYHFHSRKCIGNCRLPKWRPFCPGRDELSVQSVMIPDKWNRWENMYSLILFTETKMSSFWRNFNHWLHWKLSFWQLPVQPVMKISSKWRHFRFSVIAQGWGFLSQFLSFLYFPNFSKSPNPLLYKYHGHI